MSTPGDRRVPCIEVVDDRTAMFIRTLTPEQRWARADTLFEMSKSWMLAGIQSLHPDWTQHQVQAEWRRRFNGTR